jgi:uncharacterized protein Yka (UPF0111/DUF47 family)
MGFSAIGRMFVPKSKIFYDLFEDVVATVHQMAELLSVIVHEGEFGKRGVLIKQMEDLEHKNDEHTHKIFAELGRNFITPFDREDIHYLASALDDIADYIYSSAKKINFYKVNPNEATIHTMAGLILESCVQIKKAVLELRSMKNMRIITDALVIVNSIENQTDDIFDISVDRLFETEPDAKEVIKKREIYQVMETATDKCENAANAIESILIKYT